MSRLHRSLIVFLLAIFAIVGFVVKTFFDAGQFKSISPTAQVAVDIVEGVLSSEDITIHPQTGVAFISSADRRAVYAGSQPQQGAIFSYDLQADKPKLINITADFDKPFHPHGISLFVKPDSSVALFAINHTGTAHFVEIFDQVGEHFQHRASLQSPEMHSPNDLAAIDANRFYVTNDHGNKTAFGKTVEEYLQLRRAFVLYFDGTTFRRVAEGLGYANGINTNADGSRVFVAATVEGSVSVYRRDQESGDLTLLEKFHLETGVDNLERDRDGAFWIGAHPKLLTFVDYSKDPEVYSPSQVLRWWYDGPGQHRSEEIFVDDGARLSGSSAAAFYNGKYLVGSVFDQKFLICTLANN